MRSVKGLPLLLVAVGCLHGALSEWIQHLPDGPWQQAFFRVVEMPWGKERARRPPIETRAALSRLIAQTPKDAALYRLRAKEAELALDFAGAEADYRRFALQSSDHAAAWIEVADYLHRRNQAAAEIEALSQSAKGPDNPAQALAEQDSWKAYLRAIAVAKEHLLPAQPIYGAWIGRYPAAKEPRQQLVSYLSESGDQPAALAEIANYKRAFPEDDAYPVQARAALALEEGSVEKAIAVYNAAFQPLWPKELRESFFALIEKEGRRQEYLSEARKQRAAHPDDIAATARLFDLAFERHNLAGARESLVEYRLWQEAHGAVWRPEQLLTMAADFQLLGDSTETARHYYALYSLPGVSPENAERALAGLANLLLDSPTESIPFGTGNLSLYHDIATMDATPGFLNGILSLLLNGTGRSWAYSAQDGKAGAYFHRAAAAELTALLDRRFPRSRYRQELHAKLIDAFVAYGQSDKVLAQGSLFLAAFPQAPQRVTVAMRMADVLAASEDTVGELAIYDNMLKELGMKENGLPVGHSAEYGRVLDRELARLTALNRKMDALAVYRKELDRNPRDPGLYEHLAAYLEQNGLSDQVEQVYTKAIQQFPDHSWTHKLARWYIRQSREGELAKLSREVIRTFSGSELEAYFQTVLQGTTLDHSLYLGLNRYAHERFPDDMQFVRNLLSAYSRTPGAGSAEREALLRANWPYDAELKREFFRELAYAGKLDETLTAVRKSAPDLRTNPVAASFIAEAEAWRSHFEEAAPAYQMIAGQMPGDSEVNQEALAITRSLATINPAFTEQAATFARNVQQSNASSREALAAIGDVYADREQFAKARPYWNEMARLQPGSVDGYRDSATVFWDYYLFPDALRVIEEGRRKLQSPELLAFEAGAIREGARQYPHAIQEYLKAVDSEGSGSSSFQRLVRLARRPALRDLMETATASGGQPESRPLAELRLKVLLAAQRRQEAGRELQSWAQKWNSPELLRWVEETAKENDFDTTVETSLRRQAELAPYPADKLRLRLAIARHADSQGNAADAAREIQALYRENPKNLGIIRATVDFEIEHHQPDRAITVLLAAAGDANPEWKRPFEMEAARRATEAGRNAQSREILDTVLQSDPLQSDAIAAYLDILSREGKDDEFQSRSLAAIDLLRKSALPAATRQERIATLRRGLIPSLIRRNQFDGALDQYIEVINRFPEDAGLIAEAASFAGKHNLSSKLRSYYEQTAATAGRDYRWPIVLAHISASQEDLPAAIKFAAEALARRPDRSDVLREMALWQERLMRFADADASYRRLYNLTYRDGQWMLKAGEMEVRMGHTSEAVEAVRLSVLGGRVERPETLLEIAEILEKWSFLPQAEAHAEKAATQFGEEFFKQNSGAELCLRLRAKVRKYDSVLDGLAASDANSQRLATATGAVMAAYYSSEERAALRGILEARYTAASEATRSSLFIPLADAAKLEDLNARWRTDLIGSNPALGTEQPLVAVQTARGRFAELGRALEEFDQKLPAESHFGPVLIEAADAYRAAGDVPAETRVLSTAAEKGRLSGPRLARYLDLLEEHDPKKLVALAGGALNGRYREEAANHTLQSAQGKWALAAVQAWGESTKPVWTSAASALTEYYFDGRPNQWFVKLLESGTIGARLRKPINREIQLAGDPWFYYAERYGDALLRMGDAHADEWLPAEIERSPATARSYVLLGDAYRQSEQAQKAIDAYQRSLQLDANRPAAHDGIALALAAQGRRDQAIEEWKQAIAALLRLQTKGGAVPQTYWEDAAQLFEHAGRQRAMGALQSDLSRLFKDYLDRNKTYRFDVIASGAAQASLESGIGVEWLTSLAAENDNSDEIIAAVESCCELTFTQRQMLTRQRITVLTRRAASTAGYEQEQVRNQVDEYRLQLAELLFDNGRTAEAQSELRQLRSSVKQPRATVLTIRLAARAGTVAALLDAYRTEPAQAPASNLLLQAAAAVRRSGAKEEAQKILEFAYSKELEAGHLEQVNFLGLAEVKLEQSDLPAAQALLGRMTLVSGELFEGFVPAADLLERFGHREEAALWLIERIRSTPWDSAARLALLRLRPEKEGLAGLLGDGRIVYSERLQAAALLRNNRWPIAGETELSELTQPLISTGAAAKPYAVEARWQLAKLQDAAAGKLLAEALAIDPDRADIRTALGSALLQQRKDREAMAILLPLTPRVSEVESDSPRRRRRYGNISASPEVEASPPDENWGLLLTNLARAYSRQRELGSAVTVYEAALPQLTAHKVEAAAELASVRKQRERARENELRRPVLTAAIEMERDVRPRVEADQRRTQ